MKLIDPLFWSKVIETPSGCWEWQGALEKKGYGHVRRRAVHSSPLRAHRYAYYLKHGKFPENLCCHTCDNPPCVNPDHLYDGTSLENSRDRVNRGRVKMPPSQGSLNGNSKLTEQDVQSIKKSLSIESNVNIAKRFNVTHQLISAIRVGRIWSHVD